MNEDILQILKSDIDDIKVELRGIRKSISQQSGLTEAINSLKVDINRLHKADNEAFDRIRKLEDSRVKKEDCRTEKYISRKELATWMTVMTMIFTLMIFIINFLLGRGWNGIS